MCCKVMCCFVLWVFEYQCIVCFVEVEVVFYGYVDFYVMCGVGVVIEIVFGILVEDVDGWW